MIDLTENQLERYSRHILLDDVGVEGQEKLLQANVLIVGAGGLGCPASLYLAAAGVGTIGIIDSDSVETSNLQRQIAHFTRDIGSAKVESAAEKMRAINPDIQVKTYKDYLCAANISNIITEYDFIIDGTDNFQTKFLVNDACIFNILHICDYHGGYEDIDHFVDYPGHVVNCNLSVGSKEMTPRDVSALFNRPYMGGMERKGIIAGGDADQVRREVQRLLAQMSDRYILGADCTLPNDVNWDNIRTAIAAAHEYARG